MHKDKYWPVIGYTHDLGDQRPLALMQKMKHVIDRNVVQFFNGHATSYYRKKLSDQEAREILYYSQTIGVRAFVHSPLIINLAKDVTPADNKSIKSLHDDISAVGKAGISSICHIGKHLDKFSIESVCRTLQCLDFWGSARTYPLLLENAAGDGTELGTSWDQLAFLAQNTDPHVGFCIDTCHAFNPLKPDFTTVDGVNEFFKQLDRSIGLRRVKVIHLNDAKWNPGNPRGKKDHHEDIGKGFIWSSSALGAQPSKSDPLLGLSHLLLRGAELDIPFVIETPNPSDPEVCYAVLQRYKC